MSALPPPAASLARVDPRVRFGVRAGALEAGELPAAHVLAGVVTRCGHRTSTAWRDLGPAELPALRLCRRCTAGLPAKTRTALVPDRAELAAVYGLEARAAAEDLRRRLARIRTEALTDGAAYEATRLVYAARAPRPAATTRAELRAHVDGYVATARELTLLELLNHLDPSRPDAPGWAAWFLNEPALGTAVDVGGTYDARAWMGRKR